MKEKFTYPVQEPDPDDEAALIAADIEFKNANRAPLPDEERLQALMRESDEKYQQQYEEERRDDAADQEIIRETVEFPGSPLEEEIMKPRLDRLAAEKEVEQVRKAMDPFENTGKREE
ncbi:MAG: hypothetical protein HGB18_01815 [Candidatus Moranbacteria bacterium]|nr:hypothetical protein [Candidatus Moranbacteria bacterium]